jgi:hypothetical protein
VFLGTAGRLAEHFLPGEFYFCVSGSLGSNRKVFHINSRLLRRRLAPRPLTHSSLCSLRVDHFNCPFRSGHIEHCVNGYRPHLQLGRGSAGITKVCDRGRSWGLDNGQGVYDRGRGLGRTGVFTRALVPRPLSGSQRRGYPGVTFCPVNA